MISKPNKSNHRGSMKGKKVIAKLEASQFDITSAVEGELPKSSPLSHPQKSDLKKKKLIKPLTMGKEHQELLSFSSQVCHG